MKPHLAVPSPLGWPGRGAGVCRAEPPPPPQVMVFPGLGLSHEAFLTTAEFGTQELSRPAQMRLQVYRPVGGAGGTPSCGGSWGAWVHCTVMSAGPLATGLVSRLKVDRVGPTETVACLGWSFS